MNDEIREQIVNENNSAQNVLTSLLDRLDSSQVTELSITDVLHGNLDFSVLQDRGFESIQKIMIEKPGELTDIFNIPNSVKILNCNHQMLKEIEKMPSDLEELYVDNNVFQKFDCSSVPKLRILHISNNELQALTNLPETLEILECENNQLKELNLANTIKLKELICSNNPILRLQHVPPCISKLEMENNPFVEIDHSEDTPEEKKRGKKKLDYLESVNIFLKLKSDYETKLRKARKNAYDKGVSKKEKRQRVRDSKIPCISCKRNVGTDFLIKDNRYIALCGDNKNPCNLNIKLFKGEYMNSDTVMELYKQDLEEEKDKIIQTKMNSIFKYVNDQVLSKMFENDLKEYNETTELYNEVLQEHENMYNNLETKEQVERKTQQIYEIIENFQKFMEEFKKTGNKKVLISSIDLYKHELVPALACLRQLKYAHMYVEIENSDPPVSKLIQFPVSQHTKDYIYGEEPKVEHFVMEK